MVDSPKEVIRRRGARRMQDVPHDVHALLSHGKIESVNLMEWLATDMSRLSKVVAAEISHDVLRQAILGAGSRLHGLGIIGRLNEFGRAIAESGLAPSNPNFRRMAEHRSDLVRQWACYAVNSGRADVDLEVRLDRTLEFAADRNMSVREAAWMSFRPHLQRSLAKGLALLLPLASDTNANVRRFAVEVSRPRSVWGAHIEELKREPSRAATLLELVRGDSSRYVQLAVGNWLNDASKTRPDWVMEVSSRWLADNDENAQKIVRRGLRTLRGRRDARDGELFSSIWPAVLETT